MADMQDIYSGVFILLFCRLLGRWVQDQLSYRAQGPERVKSLVQGPDSDCAVALKLLTRLISDLKLLEMNNHIHIYFIVLFFAGTNLYLTESSRIIIHLQSFSFFFTAL